MSSEHPTSPGTGEPVVPATTPGTPLGTEPAFGAPAGATPAGDELSSGHDGAGGESWFGRHVAMLVAAAIAIVVAAVAIAGLAYYRGEMEDRNSANETAFAASVEERGATVETVECDGDTCAAVIGGQAYTVLVQEDEDGEKHFGVSAYAGD